MQLFELEMPDPFRPKEMVQITAPMPKDMGCSILVVAMYAVCFQLLWDMAATTLYRDARSGLPFIHYQSLTAGQKMQNNSLASHVWRVKKRSVFKDPCSTPSHRMSGR